ncbi:FAD-dependent oxidoreductase [Sphingorhabdus sp. 109]|jgi:3-(3-hydroxy-phenyl)propionate hydroxylase|uniref:FAD-dependent oxidoreductase n=1 Tax=Sphingorhabdus sp. 109 TaxID=2653173 RepID=UPI0012F1AB95|nr:FAD-dependent oxidoreductase [Sphingorhabdus sp. 109]VWX60281.1 3-(3-hydroxy-phenyl)propionate hydroxylase [Sphingorhabdus sp. 109]
MKKTDVVIVGAGPVGCVAGYYLARRGVEVTVIDAGDAGTQDLRASTFHPSTLEMLDTLGIADELIEMGLKAPVFQWRERSGGEAFRFDLSELADITRFPFRIQCEQYHLARMLAERIEAEPKATVLFNHRMLGYRQNENSVEVSIETPYDILNIEAQYVFGADGANSVVRKLMGAEFEGFTYPEKFLCLTSAEPLEDHIPGLDYVNYVSDPMEWLVLLRVPSLWRVLVPATESEADSYLVSDAKKEKVFSGLIGKPDVTTEHRTIYRVHQRVAKNLRDNRVMIIGDAAHLNNPLGGLGMNSGIHDAFNLCPKMIEILHGRGDADALLNQFNDERLSATIELVQAQTIQNMEFMKEGDSEQHRLRKDAMRKLVDDPVKRRSYMIRQSMLPSDRTSLPA